MTIIISVTDYAQRHEDVWVSGRIAPRSLKLGTRWKWFSASRSGLFDTGTDWTGYLYHAKRNVVL